ncbi:MAG: rod shape-determining protein MreC [Planctomycetota bacterium]
MAGRNVHFSNTSIFFSLLFAGAVLFIEPADKISLAFYASFNSVLRIGRDAQVNTLHPQPEFENTFSREGYTQLWKDFKNLEAHLLAVQKECERIAKVRATLPELSGGLVMVQITGRVSNYSNEVVINKGENSFIRAGQYVLSEQNDSLIGVVSKTSETAARVRLLTDTKQSVEVRIRRDGTKKDIGAMMIGNGANGCKISMIHKHTDVRVGDTVYAAAVSNKLNIPLVAGEVVQVKEDEQHPLLWDITVLPAEDMTQLGEVAVIVADETLLKRTE